MCVVGCDKKSWKCSQVWKCLSKWEHSLSFMWIAMERKRASRSHIMEYKRQMYRPQRQFHKYRRPSNWASSFFFHCIYTFSRCFFSPSIQLSKLLQNIDSKLQKISAPDIQWNTRINCVCKVIEIDEIVSCKQDKKPHQMKQK